MNSVLYYNFTASIGYFLYSSLVITHSTVASHYVYPFLKMNVIVAFFVYCNSYTIHKVCSFFKISIIVAERAIVCKSITFFLFLYKGLRNTCMSYLYIDCYV